MKDKLLEYTVKQEHYKWRTKYQIILQNKNTTNIWSYCETRTLQMKDIWLYCDADSQLLIENQIQQQHSESVQEWRIALHKSDRQLQMLK